MPQTWATVGLEEHDVVDIKYLKLWRRTVIEFVNCSNQ